MKRHIVLIAGILMLCLSIVLCVGCSLRNSTASNMISDNQDSILIIEDSPAPDLQLAAATIAPIPDIAKVEAKLKALGILTKNNLRASQSISVRETFEILHRFSAGYDYYYSSDYGSDYLEEWYDEDIDSKLDKLKDKEKITLMYLREESVILTSELALIDLDKELTRYQALMYITRQLGNTDGCIQDKKESAFTNRHQTLETAVKKGLIGNEESAVSDELIPKTEFFQLLYRALYATNFRGGYSGVHNFKYISIFSKKNKQMALKEKSQ